MSPLFSSIKSRLTLQILVALFLGVVLGVFLHHLSLSDKASEIVVEGVLATMGRIFIILMKMLVVPVVFVSLVCGSSAIGDLKKLGRIGVKTLVLYILTTALAIALALFVASFFNVGAGVMPVTVDTGFTITNVPSLKEVFIGMFPSNPFEALAKGEMLQVIIFSILFGVAMTMSGKSGQRVLVVFQDMNKIVMRLITIVMNLAPYGVFCLVAVLFAKSGVAILGSLLGYFFTVLVVLALQCFITYPMMLTLLARLNPITFFKKMYSAMLFAFGVSSSNASIPVVLRTVKEKLGVDNSVASFVIPLGATINMDGTAIMQGVATVFIAHAYQIDIGMAGYLTVILMATLASIGTAGVPSVGLITLAMVLQQVGLPVEGVALIIGVDRLLDMARTAVNVTGDATVCCLVGKHEKNMDLDVFSKS